MLDPYSLVEGVVSPITPLTTFSADNPATEEFVSNDDLWTFDNFLSYSSKDQITSLSQ